MAESKKRKIIIKGFEDPPTTQRTDPKKQRLLTTDIKTSGFTEEAVKTQSEPYVYNGKIHVIIGNLLSNTNYNGYCHCVSRDLVMGKGIAPLFVKKFGKPEAPQVITVPDILHQTSDATGQHIFHLVTKKNYYNKPTSADFESVVELLRKKLSEYPQDFCLGMPLMGTGLDRLPLQLLCDCILKYLSQWNIFIHVLSEATRDQFDKTMKQSQYYKK